MTRQTAGIHHITAFAGNAQANADFYAGILGLRLVKKTVNFDAPEVYHLYFGNETGSPGTLMTFFPFDGARKGRIGSGQVGWTTFVVPEGALPFWEDRLRRFSVPFIRSQRFGETYIQFADGDGLQLEIVERKQGPDSQWSFGGIPADKAIKGFGGAVLYSAAPKSTMNTLEQVMGLKRIGEDQDLVRFQAPGELGNMIDVKTEPVARGHGGAGTVHHIAWRASDHTDQERWRDWVLHHGFHSTPIVDRKYFTSIYFRETGGILFEIATDPPGFMRDEPYESLGEKLMLPEWLEPHRELIEQGLPPLTIRKGESDRA